MDYNSFRDLWHSVLQAERLLLFFPVSPTEIVDLNSMDRSYRVFLGWPETPSDWAISFS